VYKPRQVVNRNPVHALDAFELRHLLAHLEAAGRVDELHRLLALDFSPGEARADDDQHAARLFGRLRAMLGRSSPVGRERRVNAWYDAKLAADQLEEYVADVRRAWHLAEQSSRAAIQSGGRSAALGQELRYAAIISSLTAIGAALPAPLLLALVSQGIWTATRALAHAVRPERNREMAWSGGANHAELLSGLARLGYVPIALAAARTVPGASERAGAIAAVAAHAGAEMHGLLEEAIGVARSIGDPEARAHAVEALAPYLDARTFSAATELLSSQSSYVGWPVRRLARRMAELGHGGSAIDLVLMPWSPKPDGTSELDRVVLCRAVEEMAGYLAADDVRRLVGHLSDSSVDDSSRGSVLCALAPRIPNEDIERVRGLAASIDNLHLRSRLLALLTSGDPTTLRTRAREAAATQDREGRHEILLGIGRRQEGVLRSQLLEDAAKAAVSSAYAESRAENLLAVLQVCEEPQRTRLARDAFARCRKIPDAFRRSHALEKLAGMVGEPLRGKVVEHGLDAANESGNVERRAVFTRMLGGAAVAALRDELQTIGGDHTAARVALRAWLRPTVDTVFEAASIDFGYRPRSVAARAAEGVVAAGMSRQLLDAFAARRSLGDATTALTASIDHLPADLLDRAESLVKRVGRTWERAIPQAALAARLAETGRLDDAHRLCLELVAAKPKGGLEFTSANAVREVAPRLAAKGRLDLALSLCAATHDATARVLGMARSAEHAEPSEATRLLRLALTEAEEAKVMDTPHGFAASEIAGPLVRCGMMDEAVRLAEASREPVRVLASIARHADEPRRGEILALARDRALAAFEERGNRGALLSDLSCQLAASSGELHEALLKELLGEIDVETKRGLLDYKSNSAPLEQRLPFLAQHLADRASPVGHDIWRRVLHEASAYGRGRVARCLPDLAPLCAAFATSESVPEVVGALDLVAEWWP
jgi:hypothetical protein